MLPVPMPMPMHAHVAVLGGVGTGQLDEISHMLRVVMLYSQEDEVRKKTASTDRMGMGMGTAAPMRAEDSRWYHPTLNPSGAPPPGKAAGGLLGAPATGVAAAVGASKLSLPVPKKPPLPSGPAPLPPPPTAPPGSEYCLEERHRSQAWVPHRMDHKPGSHTASMHPNSGFRRSAGR